MEKFKTTTGAPDCRAWQSSMGFQAAESTHYNLFQCLFFLNRNVSDAMQGSGRVGGAMRCAEPNGALA
jgi:hypothetical protein